ACKVPCAARRYDLDVLRPDRRRRRRLLQGGRAGRKCAFGHGLCFAGAVSQATRRAGRGPTRSLSSATQFALATSGTAWPAAGYGALVIWAAGDFATTGTLWLFGWPFLCQLLAGTTLHLLAVGGGARLGIPPLIPGVN